MNGLIERLQKKKKKIATREKLFRKFKKSKLNLEEILYKEARNTVEALIKGKKEELSENIGKSKELWKIIKNWVYQIKRVPQQIYASIQKIL